MNSMSANLSGQRSEPLDILVAEDSKHDQLILQEVFTELDNNTNLHFVTDGKDLLDYLHCRNAYAAESATCRPSLVLMDLNMPRMNGHEALIAIRASPVVCMLPVVILSTSDNPKQIAQSYMEGANAYMTKTGQFNDLVSLIQKFCSFWLDGARLPETIPQLSFRSV